MLAGRYTGQTITVADRGKAGNQAVDGLSRFIDVLRQDQPQVVLLLDGYNDLNVYSAIMTKVVGAVESMVKNAACARGFGCSSAPCARAAGRGEGAAVRREKYNGGYPDGERQEGEQSWT